MNVDFVLYCESGNSSERALNLISTVSGDLVGCITNFLIRGFRGETKRKKEFTWFLESPFFDQSVPRQV